MDGLRKKPAGTPPGSDILRSSAQRFAKQNPEKNRSPLSEELYLTRGHVPRKNKKAGSFGLFLKRATWVVCLAAIAYAIFYGSFIAWKAYGAARSMEDDADRTIPLASQFRGAASAILPIKRESLRGEDEGRINILLLGSAGETNAGRNLTDTIMLMSIDTKGKKVALFSLPRDLYVQIPDTGSHTKINALYRYGLEREQGVSLIKKSIEDITDQDIHYYLVADFDGFEDIVDQLGGINVDVARDIYDPRYPGPNYSYITFELKKGLQKLDGETALKYVRERHDDPEGDFGRAKRQQQVIQAVKNKVFSLKTFLDITVISGILDILKEHIKTDMTIAEMESFIALSRQLDTQNISTTVVDAWKKDSLLKVSHVPMGGVQAFVLVPRGGNYAEIRQAAEEMFDKQAIEKRRASIAEEKASVAIVNGSDDRNIAPKIKKLLEQLGIEDVRIISDSSEEKRRDTVVIDTTNGRKLFSLDELIKKIPASLSDEQVQQPSTDLVLILGSDILVSYGFEEGTLEQLESSRDEEAVMEDLLFTK